MAKRGKTKDDWTPREKIDLFVEKVDELEGTELVANGCNMSFSVSWKRDSGFSVTLPNINKNELRSFLTVFRHFISTEEPIYLYSILNICYQYLINEELKSNLIELRNEWKLSLVNNGIKFHINSKEIKPEELMDIWINSWSHHSDMHYRRLLQSLVPYQGDLMYAYFLDALVDSTRVILYVGSGVKEGLSQGWFSF